MNREDPEDRKGEGRRDLLVHADEATAHGFSVLEVFVLPTQVAVYEVMEKSKGRNRAGRSYS